MLEWLVNIDPVVLSLGPLSIRWYALAYIAGIIIGWRYILFLAKTPGAAMSAKNVDDFIVWATIGIVAGGRLGYVLFYRPDFYFAPAELEKFVRLLPFFLPFVVYATYRYTIRRRSVADGATMPSWRSAPWSRLAAAGLATYAGALAFYVIFGEGNSLTTIVPQTFFVWQGGMSFHGGLLGVIVAITLFCRRQNLRLLAVSDMIAAATPIGLFFGRLANFINAELFGRTTDVSWGVVFPTGGPVPRHPSQLYEAGLEGIALFIVLLTILYFTKARERPGALTGALFVGYGLARIFVELFREPDPFLGFIVSGITMGQILSLPVMLLGGYLLFRALRGDPIPGAAPKTQAS